MSTAHSPLKEEIVTLLLKGPQRKSVILSKLKGDQSVTVQAVYKALDQLKRKGVCVESHEIVGLSLVYLETRHKEINIALTLYRISPTYEQLFSLSEKKRITITTKTLGLLESVWTHIDLLLIEQFGKQSSVPFLSFIPHDWFRLLREDSVNVWEAVTEKHNVHMVCVTHSLPVDKKELARRRKQSPLLQYTHNENPLKQGIETYVSVIGPFVLTATLDKAVAASLEHALEPVSMPALRSLIDAPGTFKLVVVKDSVKADHLRSRARKYFNFST